MEFVATICLLFHGNTSSKERYHIHALNTMILKYPCLVSVTAVASKKAKQSNVIVMW